MTVIVVQTMTVKIAI